FLRTTEVWANHVEDRPALLRIVLWEIAAADASEYVPLATRVRPLVEFLCEAVRVGQLEGVFRPDVDPVGFVISVAGTTAFLGLRKAVASAPAGRSVHRGAVATELRRWVELILVVN